MALSVCIPTYKRHDLLFHCLESVLTSTVRPLEVVVSDDAGEAELEARLAALPVLEGVTIRYSANRLGRGEACNSRNAIQQASNDVISLMHDDDFFLPGGIDALWQAWCAADDGVDAVFGRQRVVSADGAELADQTAATNRKYRRLEPGPVPSNLWSALMLQFPMNGMLMRRSLVLTTSIPFEDGCTDLQFGVLYAKVATRPFLLIPAEVSAYRRSVDSKSRPTTALRLDGHLTYANLAALSPSSDLERAALDHALDRAAGAAILAHAARNERREALALYARHWARLKVPAATKVKLAVIAGGLLLGLRWPEETLRRHRLGLPQLRRATPRA